MKVYARCINPYISKDKVAYSCGQCANCKKMRMMEWTIRGKHELIEQKKATFITLTYDRKHLIKSAKIKMNKYDQLGTLRQTDVQLFIKRLRKECENIKIRYIYCGEYGVKKWRPHYHMIIFGLSPADLSKEIYIKLWKMGNVDVSELSVTENCIQYVIGYITKKIPNKLGGKKIYLDNGREAPYMRTSQGIGKVWANKNKENWTKRLSIPYNGINAPVPRYYIKMIKKLEGRTVKYTITNTIKGKENINPYNYKVIDNPDGKYTKRITNNIIINKRKEHEKWKELYKNMVSENEIEKSIIHDNKIDHKRYKENKKLYKFQLNKSDTELTKLYSYTKYKVAEEGKYINKSILNETTRKNLKNIAKAKEYKNLNGIYGKRDKYEFLEELQNTA